MAHCLSRLLQVPQEVAMSFSILQASKYRALAFASSRSRCFGSFSRKVGNSYGFRSLGSITNGVKGKDREMSLMTPPFRKTSNVPEEISKSALTKFQRIQFPNAKHEMDGSSELDKLTVLAFDIETTGLFKECHRIIEIALRVLWGGEKSTFHSLVNPQREVPNKNIHGISSSEVNRPEIPRMKDLIPDLLQYVKSCQKPGGKVLLIAHNARAFDVPFLVKEFQRWDFEIPEDWIFLDSLYLARERKKLAGSMQFSQKLSLQALRELYGIPLVGPAHRAISDVNTLSMVLQELIYELDLPLSGLVQRSFTASELTNKTKNKKS